MLYILFANGMIFSFVLGYKFKELWKRVEIVEEVIKEKVDKPKEVEESPSELIDPYDVVQTAIYEAKKEQERLDAIG